MVKVDCDPAQVIVNHASFRVQLAQSPRPARALAQTALIPVVGAAGRVVRRRAPVVWSGKSAPGDAGATGLLQAVRNTTAERDAYESDRYDTGATQTIPRLDLAEDTEPTPVVPALGGGDRPLLPPMRQAVGAYDSYHSHGQERYEDDEFDLSEHGDDDRPQRHSADTVRHAYYPGRRMNLGVVLLPLRVFLGFISIYAGMGKLCDPVYFDGGERGSMVKWLNSSTHGPLPNPCGTSPSPTPSARASPSPSSRSSSASSPCSASGSASPR